MTYFGTPKNLLVEARSNAALALEEALDALSETAPHGRDYYTPDAFARALELYRERYTTLETMARKLRAEAEAIAQ